MINPRFGLDLDKIPSDIPGCFGYILGTITALAINAAVIYGIVRVVRWAWEG